MQLVEEIGRGVFEDTFPAFPPDFLWILVRRMNRAGLTFSSPDLRASTRWRRLTHRYGASSMASGESSAVASQRGVGLFRQTGFPAS
jgi:hypothetical protein